MPVWHSPRLEGNTSQESTIHNERKLEKVYAIVNKEPTYPGGTKAWFEHLRKNMRYPGTQKLKGKVVLAFDVTSNGEIVNIRVLKSFNSAYSQEAVRLLTIADKWHPALYQGEVVNASSQVRINF